MLSPTKIIDDQPSNRSGIGWWSRRGQPRCRRWRQCEWGCSPAGTCTPAHWPHQIESQLTYIFIIICWSIKFVAGEGHEQQLLPWSLRNRLQNLQISYLHGCLRIQNVSCLMHQLSTLNISFSRNDLSLRQSLGFGGHGEVLHEVGSDGHIFDENLLNVNPPFVDLPKHELLNLIWNFLSFLKQILKGVFTTKCS